jgi:hypothetical protein
MSPANDQPLSKAELAEFQRQNSLLAPSFVEDRYREALKQVADLKLPPPAAMQRLVILWKILWSWRR